MSTQRRIMQIMSLGESVWATEIKLNDGFFGQNFFGNQEMETLKHQCSWNTNTKTPAINPEDPELRKVVHANQIVVQTDVLSVLENHASTWSKIARIVALMMLFVKKLRTKKKLRKIIKSDEVTATLVTTTMIQKSRMFW